MSFIKAIISGVIELFDASVGRGTGDFQKSLIGAITLFVIVALFLFFLWLFDKTSLSGIKPIVISLLLVMVLVMFVAGVAIMVEKIKH